jgi:hypothetical protein
MNYTGVSAFNYVSPPHPILCSDGEYSNQVKEMVAPASCFVFGRQKARSFAVKEYGHFSLRQSTLVPQAA